MLKQKSIEAYTTKKKWEVLGYKVSLKIFFAIFCENTSSLMVIINSNFNMLYKIIIVFQYKKLCAGPVSWSIVKNWDTYAYQIVHVLLIIAWVTLKNVNFQFIFI